MVRLRNERDILPPFSILSLSPSSSSSRQSANISFPEGTAIDALTKGLAALQQVCDVVATEFSTKRQEFNDENGIDR